MPLICIIYLLSIYLSSIDLSIYLFLYVSYVYILVSIYLYLYLHLSIVFSTIYPLIMLCVCLLSSFFISHLLSTIPMFLFYWLFYLLKFQISSSSQFLFCKPLYSLPCLYEGALPPTHSPTPVFQPWHSPSLMHCILILIFILNFMYAYVSVWGWANMKQVPR